MTHAAEGLLQAYADGEVEASVRAELDLHLAGCARCAADLDVLRNADREVSAALALLDAPVRVEAVPQAWWTVSHKARRPGTYRVLPAVLGRAAALLVVAAGVSAAIPGSPLRSVVERWLGGEPDTPAASAPVAAPVAAPTTAPVPPAELRRAEMTVLPLEGRVRVLIWAAGEAATVRVNLVDGERVTVHAGGEEGAVRFRSGPGRLEVYDLGAGHAVIDLPRSLSQASIEVDGRQYLFKDGAGLRTPGPVTERGPETILFNVQK
jgi:anti-sigma factor RsiW